MLAEPCATSKTLTPLLSRVPSMALRIPAIRSSVQGPRKFNRRIPVPSGADVLPFTREDAQATLAKRFGPEQGRDLLGVFDAMAESWAERENADPGDWYTRHLAGIVDQARSAGRDLAGALYHPSKEEVRTADEALARDAAAWGESVDGSGRTRART